ncbi:hypothetical protein PR048_019443 [Dryococelus australis]|uniref:Fibronectin type-III domain-containing protein n=1 Tax=Dryococelus australis TaxID=614101 RepID=A0ABQ9H3I5_9NEOP|nr:hypothetical protein PR048_019443 [Dryococelus australis]
MASFGDCLPKTTVPERRFGVPRVEEVLLDGSSRNVSWEATWEPGCLKGYQVCWTSMHDRDVSCDFAPPEATSLQITLDNMEPCERFNVEVTAISRDHKSRDSRITYGVAAPYRPPRSPDLNLLDFYLWKNLKARANATLVDDVAPSVNILWRVAKQSGNFQGFIYASGCSCNGGLMHVLRLVAGPPRITGLKLTQQSRDLATLEWSSASNHSCITSVQLWLCENSTQELSTCFYTKMNSATVKFEFQNFEVCRYYYATIRAAGRIDSSPTTTLEMYLDSANEVARVEASNITQDSVLITWWVSDVKMRCQTETMKLCLQEEGGRMLPDCWEWTLGQDNPRDSIALSDLDPCAAYDVMVSLITAGKYSNKTLTFTTPMAFEALSATTESVANTVAVVKWTYEVASKDCKPTVMQVCYSRQDASDTSKMCRTLSTARHSRVRLSDLVACTSYTVVLTLLTSVGPQPNCTLSLVTKSEGTRN